MVPGGGGAHPEVIPDRLAGEEGPEESAGSPPRHVGEVEEPEPPHDLLPRLHTPP